MPAICEERWTSRKILWLPAICEERLNKQEESMVASYMSGKVEQAGRVYSCQLYVSVGIQSGQMIRSNECDVSCT